MHVVKLFTNPPRPYPYVLINVIRPKFSPEKYGAIIRTETLDAFISDKKEGC
jgi:hypothetical protein